MQFRLDKLLSEINLDRLPRHVSGRDIIIYEHLRLEPNEPALDWYVASYNEHRNELFVFSIVGNALSSAEWEYVSFDSLLDAANRPGRELVRDADWEPRRAYDVGPIRDAHDQYGNW